MELQLTIILFIGNSFVGTENRNRLTKVAINYYLSYDKLKIWNKQKMILQL